MTSEFQVGNRFEGFGRGHMEVVAVHLCVDSLWNRHIVHYVVDGRTGCIGDYNLRALIARGVIRRVV